MTVDEIKTAVKSLSTAERRQVALFIVELEKKHVQETIGPRITEELENVSRTLQDAVERIKKNVEDVL